MALTVIERMRREGFGLRCAERCLPPRAGRTGRLRRSFCGRGSGQPDSYGCQPITPEMVPLVKLTPGEIEKIVNSGAGRSGQHTGHLSAGAAAGGHPLPPPVRRRRRSLPAGHSVQLRHPCAGAFVDALEAVIDRHDILRTAVLWEGLSEPVQVVWRRTPLPVDEMELDRAREIGASSCSACLNRGSTGSTYVRRR